MNPLATLADKLHRDRVLERDGYRCCYCGRGEEPNRWLERAHVLGRGARYVRWDLDNAVTLCVWDHRYFTDHPDRWRLFVAQHFGPDHYDMLRRRNAALERRGGHVDMDAVIAQLRVPVLQPTERARHESGAW